jgi:Cu-Zn family superoxide dismutase
VIVIIFYEEESPYRRHRCSVTGAAPHLGAGEAGPESGAPEMGFPNRVCDARVAPNRYRIVVDKETEMKSRVITSILVALGTAPLLASAAMAQDVTHAIAIVLPTEGNSARGIVTFQAAEGGVRVHAELTGLSEGNHGFHVHQYGDCSALDGTSAGGHFNPTGHDHAGPHAETQHVGDLGNIVATADGTATYDAVLPYLALSGPNSIIGRGLIVHTGEDDLATQPTGNAGAREGCGVIGVDETPQPTSAPN